MSVWISLQIILTLGKTMSMEHYSTPSPINVELCSVHLSPTTRSSTVLFVQNNEIKISQLYQLIKVIKIFVKKKSLNENSIK